MKKDYHFGFVNRAPSGDEPGVVMVLFALLITAIFFGLALAIDGAFYTSQDSNLKSITDITALSALDAYAKNPVNLLAGIPDENYRRQLARDYAENILNRHQLVSSHSPLNDIDTNGVSTGDLRFGSYFPDSNSAAGSGTPCDVPNTTFPCWAESTATSPPEPVGSVLVTNRTAASDPIVGFISNRSLNLKATSVATVVDSCLVSALDVSNSTVDQSHNTFLDYCVNRSIGYKECASIQQPHPEYLNSSSGDTGANQNPAVIVTVPTAGPIGGGITTMTPVSSNFVFEQDVIFPSGIEIDCSDLAAVTGAGNQAIIWCSLHQNRNAFATARGVPLSALPSDLYFRSDYIPITVGGGIGPQKNVFVNAYRYPEPFRTFMLTANATGRFLFSASSQHSALNLAFTADITAASLGVSPRALPLPVSGNYYLGSNLKAMTQLTNMDMMAAVDEYGTPIASRPWKHPNFMDWLFFPDATTPGGTGSSTNLPRALNVAAEAIAFSNSQPGGRCGDRASKQILLMSDGIGTCSYFDSTFTTGRSNLPDEFDCNGSIYTSSFDRYVRSEFALMTDITDYLVDRGLIMNSFITLPGIRYKNLLAPGKTVACLSDDTDANCLIDVWTAGQFASPGNPIGIELPPPTPSGAPAGYDLGTCDPNTAFIDCSSEDNSGNPISPAAAFTAVNGGNESYRFLRPANVLARMSYLTGGIFCPLLPLSGVSVNDYIDHDNDHSPGSGCTLGTTAACCQESTSAGMGTPCILKNSLRTLGAWETRPPVYADQSGQAYLCSIQAVGLSPYVVKKPKKIFCSTCNA